jgi:glycosyltransferase involved in cell wall biosynthesis
MPKPPIAPAAAGRVVMFVYNDVRTDARVLREAATLAATGRRVTIVGRPTDPAATAVDREVRPDGVEILRVPLPSAWRRPWRVAGAPLRWGAALLGRLRGRSDGGRTLAWLVNWRFAILGWARAAAAAAPPAAVWHGHDLTGLPAAARAAERGGGRLVYDAHELFLEAHGAVTQPGWARRIVGRVERRLAARADALVTVNDELASVLAADLRPARTVVAHNCPPRWVPPSPRPDRLRAAARIPAEAPVLLYHGSVAPERGLPQLVAALERPALGGAHLAILAVGRPDPALSAALAISPAADRVHLLPAVAPDELPPWVASADLAVMPIQPSTRNHRLSTPNKLFEALAAGVPVLASDFPAMRRIVLDDPDGPLGAVCDPADPDAIAAAAAALLGLDDAAAAALRARCLRAAHARWCWEIEGARLVALYDDLDPAPAGR